MRRWAVLAGCALWMLAGCRSAPTVTAKAAPQLCEAKSLAWLVGKPRTAIPVAIDPSKWRVSCTSCPAAGDVRPDRSNILFDARTGTVVSVTCG